MFSQFIHIVIFDYFFILINFWFLLSYCIALYLRSSLCCCHQLIATLSFVETFFQMSKIIKQPFSLFSVFEVISSRSFSAALVFLSFPRCLLHTSHNWAMSPYRTLALSLTFVINASKVLLLEWLTLRQVKITSAMREHPLQWALFIVNGRLSQQ